ncbi:MAG: nicotinamide-nucleotide amidohydrolase family protein [Candidatus Kapaibacterium sp.]|nr:MAG: nicotinamide-nucleotide amidohydrolase family protein [Candidatus Kapabacteria bacterium]
MNISLLTIGDEICIGQIVNTNAAWMAEACAKEGWRVVAHSVVGDDLPQILSEFERLLSLTDIVLITGGLGPTHDDRTKTALLDYLHDSLRLHEPTLEHLKALFQRFGRELSERNAAQALLPASCTPLQNDKGTAAGMWFTLGKTSNEANAEAAEVHGEAGKRHAGKVLVSMPGVPHEMKHLMEERVIPRLRERAVGEEVMLYRTLMTTGIVESSLADLIGDVDAVLEGQELAFLPSASGVKLRITVTAAQRTNAEEMLNRIDERIRSLAGRYIYGVDGASYEALLGQKLREKGLTLAVAESCTGGLLGATLTNMRGSSAYFLGGVQCYSNEAKMSMVGVSPETLRQHGAVSQEVAMELAAGIQARFHADIGVSITGIAGPDGGTPEKPVGTIWVGICAKNQTPFAQKFSTGNDRATNRERAVMAAMQLVYKRVMEE